MITKVVIPAAGNGTRFFPLTRSLPKEMLPLLEKPAIQYSVEEAVRSGVENFLVIVNKNKKILEDHFDLISESYAQQLYENGKGQAAEVLAKIIKRASFAYIRQGEQRGLGHAVSLAAGLIHEHYFGVMLPDDIILSSTPCISALAKIAYQEKGSVIAVQEVPYENVSRYGIVSFKKQLTPNLFQVKDLVEKPLPNNAPSNFAIVGRYVLSSSIFEYFGNHQQQEGEWQLTDTIREMVQSGERLFAYKVQGTVLDAGTPIGYLKSVIQMALRHPTYAKEIGEYLQTIQKDELLYDKIAGSSSILNV